MAFFSFGNSKSRSNKRLYVGVVVLLVIAVVYWVARKDFSSNPEQQLSQLDKPSRTGFDTNTPASVNDDSSLKQQPLKVGEDKAALVAAESIVPDAWSAAGTEVAAPKIPLPEGVSVYEPVSVDMENPKYPEPGEQLSVAMPGGEQLRVNIETGVTNPNGDYTWRGHLDGHGDEYPVVMTYGGNSVFATVTTPKGSYTLISVNGSGWIYKNPSEFELSHPGTNDYLDIPREHK